MWTFAERREKTIDDGGIKSETKRLEKS